MTVITWKVFLPSTFISLIFPLLSPKNINLLTRFLDLSRKLSFWFFDNNWLSIVNVIGKLRLGAGVRQEQSAAVEPCNLKVLVGWSALAHLLCDLGPFSLCYCNCIKAVQIPTVPHYIGTHSAWHTQVHNMRMKQHKWLWKCMLTSGFSRPKQNEIFSDLLGEY